MNEPVRTDREHGELSPEAYELMCVSLYAYRLGTIDFLELVTCLEQALGLQPPQPEKQAVSE